MGAARDMETAKEVRINGHRRGIFTYSLLQILHQTLGTIPYDELINRINKTVRKAVSNQSSQLMVANTEDKRLLFLTTKPAPQKPIYLVSHDLAHGWTIDIGSIYGITKGDDYFQTRFKLIQNGRFIEVLEVFPLFSKVGPMEGCNTSQVFNATLEELATPRFKLAFSKESTLESKNLISREVEKNASDIFHLTSDCTEVDFLIHADDQTLSLSRLKDKRVIGKPVTSISEELVSVFLSEVETMLKWFQVLLLDNPSSSIKPRELEISLNKVTETGNYKDDTRTLGVDWTSPQRFDYIYADKEWHKPAFQLNIKNAGERPLSVSVLYLGADFSVSNQLVQMQILEPGQDVWALDYDDDGNSYITIQLQVEDQYMEEGVDSVYEYLKLVICTDPFDTDRFNQDGINWQDSNRSTIKRTVKSRRSQIRKTDWITFELPLLIDRPKKSI